MIFEYFSFAKASDNHFRLSSGLSRQNQTQKPQSDFFMN